MGAILALLAAVCWGGGDFSGGMGSKAAGGDLGGTLRVLITAHALSLCVLVGWVLWRGTWLLRVGPVTWAFCSGIVAALAIAAFYIALGRGAMGASAAVSGLLAAAIPAAVGTLMEGRPTPLRLAGFVLAAAAIWLIAASETASAKTPSRQGRPGTMTLAIFGGIGFGVYFVGLRLANGLGVIEAPMLARAGSVLTCLSLYLLPGRRKAAQQTGYAWLSRAGWGWALGVALLDTGGNLLFLAATRAGRLDVAAVLASLYPATTILLAAGVLHERLGRRQVVGMGVAVAAAVLVSL